MIFLFLFLYLLHLLHNVFLFLLQNGDTPLHVSSLFGHVTCTRILISAGSNVNIKNKVRARTKMGVTEEYAHPGYPLHNSLVLTHFFTAFFATFLDLPFLLLIFLMFYSFSEFGRYFFLRIWKVHPATDKFRRVHPHNTCCLCSQIFEK